MKKKREKLKKKKKLTQIFFFLACHKNFDQKCFLPFSQKISIFGQIWYQKQILWLISIPKMYTFIYITVIIRKLQRAIFFTISGITLPLKQEQFCSSNIFQMDHFSAVKFAAKVYEKNSFDQYQNLQKLEKRLKNKQGCATQMG